MCYAVPIMPSVAEMREYLDNDMPADAFRGEAVTQPPQSFAEFITQNKENIQLQNPYWYRHNQKVVNKMAFNKTEVIGNVNLSQKEMNTIASNIRDIAQKCDLFNKALNIQFDKFDNTTMMTWHDNTLTITTAKHRLNDDTVFCPVEHLQSAFLKLHNKQPLSFYEEYSIECLFHENVHSKATRKYMIRQGSLDEKIAETCTQLYAREKYVKILRSFGVEPSHFINIKYNGLGYQRECNALRKYFEKDGFMQIGELLNVANETESGYKKMIRKLINLGISRQQAKLSLVELL